MLHPFDTLLPEYTALLARVQITRPAVVEAVASKLLSFIKAGRYDEACAATGVPKIVAAASFEREASSVFSLSPAQGDPWNQVSRHVPAGRGPFASWAAAAIDAYHLDHLDAVGAENWSWQRACYEEELFNGFGYRSHGVHTPYLWAGTNNYSEGKFVADGRFEPYVSDSQIGIVPMMLRLVALAPELRLSNDQNMIAALLSPTPPVLPQPLPAPEGLHDAADLQAALNKLGATPALTVDDNFGRETRRAVEAFQASHNLTVDGLAGPATWVAVAADLAAGTGATP
jgi:lysozyme family protein